MCQFVRRASILCLVLLSCTAFSVPSQAQDTPHLDKHARKIHRKLAKYQAGHYLHLVLRNSTDSYGSLGTLSPASFTFTNSDTNSAATYSYSDIAKVKTDKEPIGEGSEPTHFFRRHWKPIVAVAAAAGVGAGIYAAER